MFFLGNEKTYQRFIFEKNMTKEALKKLRDEMMQNAIEARKENEMSQHRKFLDISVILNDLVHGNEKRVCDDIWCPLNKRQ